MKPRKINESKPPAPSGKPPKPSGSGTGQQTPTTTSTIPEFLGNVDGVKKFQDWLDQNHPGWVPTGKLEKRGGYGRFGPKTTAAWNSYGEEYKKSGTTNLSTPETGTGAEQSEEYKWFKENEQKGLFSGGEIKKIRSGHWTYKKPANLIDGDSDGIGDYYFLKGDKPTAPWRWVKWQKNEKGTFQVDEGTYELPELAIESRNMDKTLAEQIILSRKSASQKPTQTTGTSSPTATPTTQTVDSEKTLAIKNYKKFFLYLGIPDDPVTGKPEENTLYSIYRGILGALTQGYQSVYFYYFKKGVELLKSVYPNEYTNIDSNNITTKVDINHFINYPDSDINQLEDPITQKEQFNKIPLEKLISAFPPSTPDGAFVYIWPNVVSGIDTSKISSKMADINDEKCLTTLFEWHTNFTGNLQIDQRNSERVKTYLMACNDQCKFTNKDESFFKRMGKPGEQKSADRMISDLKDPSAKQYRINFADVRQKCKSRGREARALGVTSENKKVSTNLKKMIRENLITEKTKKQRLLKESKIIKNRLYVLLEDKTKLKSQADYNKLFNSLIVEANFLREQGFDEKLIQESWFNFLGKLGFGGFADALQERLVQWLLETFKIPKSSYLANLLIVGFANFDLDNIGKILSGDCNTLVKFIAETIVEAFARKKMSTSGETNYLEDTLRNAISDILFKDKSELIKAVEDKLISFICPQLSKISSNFSDVTGQLRQNLMGS
jgi:hypothetical protein